MSYIKQIQQYSENLPVELQQEIKLQVKKLHVRGFSYEWIYTALSHKTCGEWLRYGFGLLWTRSYQNQITRYLEREHTQLGNASAESITWESLLSEEEEEQTSAPTYSYNFDYLLTK